MSANRLLDETFVGSFNEQFTVLATDATDAHRACAVELSAVLCEHHERAVGRDWCVQWRGTLLQIDKRHESLCLAGKTVTLRQLRGGGELQVLWQGQQLTCGPLERRPRRAKPKPTIVNNKRWKPPASRPWKADLPPHAVRRLRLLAPCGEDNQRTFLLR